VDLHKLLDAQAFEWRDDCFVLRLHEHCIESVLVANRLEDVQLDQREAMSLAILKLLEELALRLIVQVSVLGVLDVTQPNGRVYYL
jgi:hypothetical protein